jgi:DNA-binding NarL/FixJ family response regulator
MSAGDTGAEREHDDDARVTGEVRHAPQRPELTVRELAIVELLARGLSNAEIGEQLHLAEATVKAHLGRVMAKWQVRDRLQVVLMHLGRFEPRSDR